jgi:hypothetical protein
MLSFILYFLVISLIYVRLLNVVRYISQSYKYLLRHCTLLKLSVYLLLSSIDVCWCVILSLIGLCIIYSFLLVLETFCFVNFPSDPLGGALLVSNNISHCFILLFRFSFHSRLFFLFLPLNVAPFPPLSYKPVEGRRAF